MTSAHRVPGSYTHSAWHIVHPLRRCSGQGPHLAKTLEPRVFSRVAAGLSSPGRIGIQCREGGIDQIRRTGTSCQVQESFAKVWSLMMKPVGKSQHIEDYQINPLIPF